MSGIRTGTDVEAVVRRLLAGERRAIADALTSLEQLDAAAGRLLAGLRPHLGRAIIAGITGPPGAGKSTLVNGLIGRARGAGHRVAVLAVDPSSPVTGGAILGDRIRMTAAADDDGVLIRSLGSRGALGGLTPAAVRMIDALDAAGFGLILIETVGTGQSEVDVAEVADVVLVVSAPGLGDGVQAMKAGLLEVADILVVNKADREGAERTAEELHAAVAMRAHGGRVPVIKTAAASGLGLGELWSLLLEHAAPRQAQGVDARRRRRARYLIARAAAELVAAEIRRGGPLADELADAVLAGALMPAEAGARLLGPLSAAGGPGRCGG